MNKKMKKILALVLTACMAFTMSTTAFAARGDTTDPGTTNPGTTNPGTSNPGSNTPAASGATQVEQSMDYEIVMQTPTIEVELTSNNAIIMNPYMLSYKDPITGDDIDGTGGSTIQSLATAVNIITSKTLAPLDVDVTVTATAPEGVTLASAKPANSTDKELFLQFALQGAADDDVTTPSWTGAGDGGSWTATAKAKWAEKTEVAKATNKAALITLEGEPVTMGEDADDPYYVMAAAADADTPVYAAFKLCGVMNEKSEEPWTAADTVSASVAFTFNIMSNGQLT